MIAAWVLIDLIATSGIAVATSWFFTSRYLARRTNDRLGRDDVALLRDMAMTLSTITTMDDMVGEQFALPANVRKQIDEHLAKYRNTKELPG